MFRGLAGVAVTVIAIGCLAAGCGQSSPAGHPGTVAQCVRAVFDVLSGMVNRPFDDRPFQDFVVRYGTGSVAYTTYRDLFTSFHRLANSVGVRATEDRLRPIATRDCANGR
jgi:hypothetical protein